MMSSLFTNKMWVVTQCAVPAVSRGLETAVHLLAGDGAGLGHRGCCPAVSPDAMPASPGQPDGLIPHRGDSAEASARNLVRGRGSLLGATWSNTGDAAGREGGCQGATRPCGERRALWAQDSHRHRGFAGLHCPRTELEKPCSTGVVFSHYLVGAFCLCWVLAAARLPSAWGQPGCRPLRCAGLSLRRRRSSQGAGSSVRGLQELWPPGPRAHAQ